MGYTPDFVQSLAPLLQQVKEKGIKVVSNAGGINPSSCVDALRSAAEKAGVQLSIGMVAGDDLLSKVCGWGTCAWAAKGTIQGWGDVLSSSIPHCHYCFQLCMLIVWVMILER